MQLPVRHFRTRQLEKSTHPKADGPRTAAPLRSTLPDRVSSKTAASDQGGPGPFKKSGAARTDNQVILLLAHITHARDHICHLLRAVPEEGCDNRSGAASAQQLLAVERGSHAGARQIRETNCLTEAQCLRPIESSEDKDGSSKDGGRGADCGADEHWCWLPGVLANIVELACLCWPVLDVGSALPGVATQSEQSMLVQRYQRKARPRAAQRRQGRPATLSLIQRLHRR